MRKLSIFMWGILFSFLICSSGLAEQPASINLADAINICQKYLADAGLENIEIQANLKQTICISYENRRFRNEITALGIVLGYAVKCFPFAIQFIIVPKCRDVAIKHIKVNCNKFQKYVRNEISEEDFIKHLEVSYHPISAQVAGGYKTRNFKSTFFRFDLIASPGVKAQFARPNDPAQMQFNLLTDLSVTLARGLQFNSQWMFPIYNEFQVIESSYRLGQLYLNQVVRLPSNTFFNMSIGMFEYDCPGISTQLKKFIFKDNLRLAVRFDYLKAQSLQEYIAVNSSCKNNTSYLFQAQYFFEQINFRTELTWGKYVLGDKGWRIDITRTFHELELGFMGVWSESLEFLTGMTIRLPFPLSRHPAPARVRIRPPRYFHWDYRYQPCFDGFILNTGDNFEQIARQFSKGFIKANIHQFKTATRYVKFDEPEQSKQLLAEGES